MFIVDYLLCIWSIQFLNRSIVMDRRYGPIYSKVMMDETGTEDNGRLHPPSKKRLPWDRGPLPYLNALGSGSRTYERGDDNTVPYGKGSAGTYLGPRRW